jgi:hypothetical protein
MAHNHAIWGTAACQPPHFKVQGPNNNVTEWVALLFCLREISDASLGLRTGVIEFLQLPSSSDCFTPEAGIPAECSVPQIRSGRYDPTGHLTQNLLLILLLFN